MDPTGYPDAAEFEDLLSLHVEDENTLEFFVSVYENVLNEWFVARETMTKLNEVLNPR